MRWAGSTLRSGKRARASAVKVCARVAGGGVDGEAGRLVDHQQRRRRRAPPRTRAGVSGSGSASLRSAKRRPGSDAGGGLEPYRPVLRLQPVLDEELDPLAGEPADLLLKVAVEPPPGVVLLDREADPHLATAAP